MQRQKFFGWLALIGSFRDGLLVLATILYTLGYLVWSYHAWKKNLGPRSALDFQYFVAGIVPALSLCILYLSFRGIGILRKKSPLWLAPGVTGGRLLLRRTIFATCLISGAISLHNIRTMGFEFPDAVLASPLTTASSFLFILSLFFLPPTKRTQPTRNTGRTVRPDNRTRGRIVAFLGRTADAARVYLSEHSARIGALMGTLYVVLLILLFSMLGVFFFSERVYPSIPQEFGGVRPRCAYLDVARDQLSDETLRGIVGTSATSPNEKVVRSLKLNVVFAGGDVLLATPLGNRRETNFTVYEIRKEILHAVTWCDDNQVVGIQAPTFAQLRPPLQVLLQRSGLDYDHLSDLQKAGLLNFAAKAEATLLHSGKPLFSYIQKILSISPESVAGIGSEDLLSEVRNSPYSLKPVVSATGQSTTLEVEQSFATLDAAGNLRITFFRSLGGPRPVQFDFIHPSGAHPHKISEILLHYQSLDVGYKWIYAR